MGYREVILRKEERFLAFVGLLDGFDSLKKKSFNIIKALLNISQ